MKSLPFFLALALCLWGSTILAQDPPLPVQEPETSPSPAGSPTEQTRANLIPPGLLPKDDLAKPIVPEIPQLDAGFSPPPPSPIVQLQRQHVEWRRLLNATENDPDMKVALAIATAARTDLEKRKLLGRYYDLLYDKIMARAPSEMKAYLTARRREAVGSLPQPRVRPNVAMSKTVPIIPSPTPHASSTPVFPRPKGF